MSLRWALTSDGLNEKLTELEARDDLVLIRGLAEYGKALPYIGWYWRDVDWDRVPYPLADCGPFVGFIVNDKWGYDPIVPTVRECGTIRTLAENVAMSGAEVDAQRLFDYLQTLRTEASQRSAEKVRAEVDELQREALRGRTLDELLEAMDVG